MQRSIRRAKKIKQVVRDRIRDMPEIADSGAQRVTVAGGTGSPEAALAVEGLIEKGCKDGTGSPAYRRRADDRDARLPGCGSRWRVLGRVPAGPCRTSTSEGE